MQSLFISSLQVIDTRFVRENLQKLQSLNIKTKLAEACLKISQNVDNITDEVIYGFLSHLNCLHGTEAGAPEYFRKCHDLKLQDLFIKSAEAMIFGTVGLSLHFWNTSACRIADILIKHLHVGKIEHVTDIGFPDKTGAALCSTIVPVNFL